MCLEHLLGVAEARDLFKWSLCQFLYKIIWVVLLARYPIVDRNILLAKIFLWAWVFAYLIGPIRASGNSTKKEVFFGCILFSTVLRISLMSLRRFSLHLMRLGYWFRSHHLSLLPYSFHQQQAKLESNYFLSSCFLHKIPVFLLLYNTTILNFVKWIYVLKSLLEWLKNVFPFFFFRYCDSQGLLANWEGGSSVNPSSTIVAVG